MKSRAEGDHVGMAGYKVAQGIRSVHPASKCRPCVCLHKDDGTYVIVREVFMGQRLKRSTPYPLPNHSTEIYGTF